MADRSKFQQKVINNYYGNREAIAMQRSQELVTELYLTSGKKRQQHWGQLAGHLEKLGVAKATIDHLLEEDKPELAAGLIEKLMAKT